MSGRIPTGALGQRAVGTPPAGYVPDKSAAVNRALFFVLLHNGDPTIVIANYLVNLNLICKIKKYY